MSRENRLELVHELESSRKTRVVCYLTGDRTGQETKIGSDIFGLVYEHLDSIGDVECLDLFLYSTGGVTMAGWGLIRLLRQFCKRLSVIVPLKAHSCATLMALGADEIVMGKLGQLSPVGPSVNSPFNPPAPGRSSDRGIQLLAVNVEDVIGYLDLARKEAGLEGKTELGEVFQKLSSDVHPLALGAVYRAREQIRMLARKLLKLHAEPKEDGAIERIVEVLTKELFSHDYIINREEAKNEIGLNVTYPDDQEEKVIWHLFKDFEHEMELNVPYDPDAILGTETDAVVTLRRAFIESQAFTDAFITDIELRRVQAPQPGTPIPLIGIQQRKTREKWSRVFPES